MIPLIVTAFEPFGGDTVNAAQAAVEALPERIGEFCLHKCLLPVEFGAAAAPVTALADRLRAGIILCVGQAKGRDAVTPEAVARNLRRASIPDNAGFRPTDQPVIPGAPETCPATLSPEGMAEAIRRGGIPARVSRDAGGFVCNDLFFTLLHRYRGTEVRVGFLHVPGLPVQGEPAMETAAAARALILAVGSLAARP